ncbi:hypothetical protein JHK82_022528 [Glycine max]|uniref:Uncharacterized protein n=1 Tax=Glycine max TaxID=3847 RepID=A0A0R0ISR0_SOYBN|nr:hypothetical protein JHK87_022437 [Glycine soja]KAG5016884.1 hypothetical protein JHK85_023020 [Glycine max]KAG5026630.1 hypothetical protein JHK86_022544 [Glycine max]KAG5137797.1 hypothetical protein JHK82_022528 [Glycine max]
MEEGYSTNKPSLLRGIKYDYCKERVTTHFESIHIDLWEVVENDNYISYDVELNEILRKEYTKVHSFRSAKQMWNTLAITYKGSSQVKRNNIKLSLLTHKYEMFRMEEGKDIQCMFECFQTILNELRALCRTFDNYDNIDKILRKECVGTLKVHEQELQQDEEIKKGKSLALNAQKAKKSSSPKESTSRPSIKGSIKALNVDDSSQGEYEDDKLEKYDQLAFISKKIRRMWKKKGGSNWKGSFKKKSRDMKDRENSSMI